MDPQEGSAPSAEVDARPAERSPEAGGSSTPEPPAEPSTAAPEISPLVPKSYIPFLDDHALELGSARYQPGKGLTFESKSGKFALTTGLRAQFRYTLHSQHDDSELEDDEPPLSHSLQIRRARLVFKGHMFGEHNKFKTELSFSPRDIKLSKDSGARFTILRDFYFTFDHLQSLALRIGQYKLPYSQQRVISSGRLQLIDRSIVGSEFDFDRDIGLDIRSKDFMGWGRLRYYAGVFMGGGRDNFDQEPLTRGGGLVYLARVEVAPFGQFSDYSEGDFKRTKKPRVSLGAAYSYMDDAIFMRGTKGSKPEDGGTVNYHNANASLMIKILGFSAFGEFFWRRGWRRPGDATIIDEMGNELPAPVTAPRNGLGWFAQAGYMIPRAPVELAARYSQVRAIGADAETSTSDKDELGGGVSWYIGAGHAFKLQADYFRIWDASIARGLDELRVQLQVSF